MDAGIGPQNFSTNRETPFFMARRLSELGQKDPTFTKKMAGTIY